MTTLSSLLNDVSNDQVSGSSEIYDKLLDGLQSALAERPKVQEWTDFAVGLSNVKRSMAPVQNEAGSIKVLLLARIPDEQFNGFIKGFLADLRKREAEATGKIANTLVGSYRPAKVVTISYSGTIMGAIKALPKDVKVSVAESLPMGEGAITCRKLMERGYEACLFRDSMAPTEIREADLVITGADGVCPEGVVNKVGTMSMALAAKQHGKPFVVLCSTSKLIPVLQMDAVEGECSSQELKVKEIVFEMTPLDLVTAFITDEGAISGTEMRSRLLRDRSRMSDTECQTC